MPVSCSPLTVEQEARPYRAGDPSVLVHRLCLTAKREIFLRVRLTTFVHLRPEIVKLRRRRNVAVRAVVHGATLRETVQAGLSGGEQLIGPNGVLIMSNRPLARELVLIDRRCALVLEQLSSAVDSAPSRGLMVDEPLAVRAIHDLVLSGAGAEPLGTATSPAGLTGDAGEYPPGCSTAIELIDADVLSCLAEGCNDAGAAARLGLSVRTYRRRVATLMQALQAQTRFQAALAARSSRLI